MFVRNAVIKDADRLIDLLKQMSPTYAMDIKTMQQRIQAFEKQNHQLLVAEDNSQIVGVISFSCYEHFRLPGCCCHIDTLVVDQAQRGKGIGKLLIHHAEDYAKKHGAIEVELITANYRRSDGTHDFYESLGYKDHQALDYTYFSKNL